MNGKVLLWLCLVLLVVACQIQVEPEFTAVPQVEPGVAMAPQIGNIVPIGEPEKVNLRPTTEKVRNCTGSVASVTKNPTMTTLTGHNIEWDVNGQIGVGATIGQGVIPFGIDLNGTIERTVGESIEQSISQSVSWNLSAAPGEVVEYTLDWWELWQRGYLDVTMADKTIVRVNLRYRTGIQSEITDGIAYDCGGQVIGGATVESNSSPSQPPVPVTQSVTFEVFASLSWQDTGVIIESGDGVRIIWDGASRWRGINSGDFSDPLGGYDDPNAEYSCSPLLPVQEAGWNALVAKVGESGLVTNPFRVDPSGQGRLYLAMNDCDQQRYDNEGSVIVTIEVHH